MLSYPAANFDPAHAHPADPDARHPNENARLPHQKANPPPRPSVVEGIARILDFNGSLNTYTAADFEQLYRDLRARRRAMPTGPEADAQAIYDCWLEVGNCLRGAMGQPPQEQPARRCNPQNDETD